MRGMNTADKAFAALLIFLPAAITLSLVHAPPLWLFAAAAIAIVPLSKYLGDATEELTEYVGVALGGILNATFGNATELVIALFALQHGLLEIVKASIVGSILANLLLVLGFAMFLGGIRHKRQTFNQTAAKSAGSTLLLVTLALIIPATFLANSGQGSAGAVETLSMIVAVLLIIAYGASIVFSLWTHKHLYALGTVERGSTWSKRTCIIVLILSTLAVAYMSDILVNSIEPVVAVLGWTPMFIGVVVLAIIGNVAEHASAVRVAIKNKVDLALQISIGSATQIAMFAAPVLVIASLFLGHPMNFVFGTFELVALIMSVVVVNSVVEDGESNWFEGLLLLIGYIVIATAFFLYP